MHAALLRRRWPWLEHGQHPARRWPITLGLVIYSVYNGYWHWGRPSIEDLRRDLREVTREIRPDWDLPAPGLQQRGDYDFGWVMRLADGYNVSGVPLTPGARPVT
jgi:hypothetical protein